MAASWPAVECVFPSRSPHQRGAFVVVGRQQTEKGRASATRDSRRAKLMLPPYRGDQPSSEPVAGGGASLDSARPRARSTSCASFTSQCRKFDRRSTRLTSRDVLPSKHHDLACIHPGLGMSCHAPIIPPILCTPPPRPAAIQNKRQPGIRPTRKQAPPPSNGYVLEGEGWSAISGRRVCGSVGPRLTLPTWLCGRPLDDLRFFSPSTSYESVTCHYVITIIVRITSTAYHPHHLVVIIIHSVIQ
jgi:hypothetical protein